MLAADATLATPADFTLLFGFLSLRLRHKTLITMPLHKSYAICAPRAMVDAANRYGALSAIVTLRAMLRAAAALFRYMIALLLMLTYDCCFRRYYANI